VRGTDFDDCVGAVYFPERERDESTQSAQNYWTQDSDARPRVWGATKSNADEEDSEAASEKKYTHKVELCELLASGFTLFLEVQEGWRPIEYQDEQEAQPVNYESNVIGPAPGCDRDDTVRFRMAVSTRSVNIQLRLLTNWSSKRRAGQRYQGQDGQSLAPILLGHNLARRRKCELL
jgi:hypothetical protein